MKARTRRRASAATTEAVLVQLLRIEDTLCREDSSATDAISNAISELYTATFGDMYRDCASDCGKCPVCRGGDETLAATPPYLAMLLQARHEAPLAVAA